MRKLTEIPATIFSQSKDINRKFRVAAYCRVSTEKEEQENSLENQFIYYKNKIENTPNWTLVEIFSDFGISGINDKNRIEFRRMIDMCDKGKIDLIITKSISRFARNTVDCLTYVRKLKANNIGVIFEKEGINTLDAVSETFLTWFSAFAQAESESLSQNITRGKRMGYKEGKFKFPPFIYGYDRGDGITPVIIPEQASVIRKIFHMYLEGMSMIEIKKWLDENEIVTPRGTKVWSTSTVYGILKNEKYKGDVLLQKRYTVDFLTKTTAKNKGEVAQYYIENNHEGIVSREIFDMVQDEIQRRFNLHSGNKQSKYSSQYALTGKVFCEGCGWKYRRVTWSKKSGKKIVWRCTNKLENGFQNCPNSPTILETELKKIILSGLPQNSLKLSSISEMIKSEIGAVIYKNENENEYTIKNRIKKFEKELKILNQIANEAEDNIVYLERIKKCEKEITELNLKLNICSKGEMKNIEEFINDNEVNMLEYFDAVVKDTVETVLISSQNQIIIKYVGGTEITKSF